MQLNPGVVYFNQHLGVAHSKQWSKSAFLTFLAGFQKMLIAEMTQNEAKIMFLGLFRHPHVGSTKMLVFTLENCYVIL